ncbi:hypothetical protein V9T40_009098 [Parthenolecanium corni]|uniref:Enoyl-CoA hydratase n=1 Tax=Parthenolecanium corni TaxID=536013 RepID=A0AAN9TMY0_9HEMI
MFKKLILKNSFNVKKYLSSFFSTTTAQSGSDVLVDQLSENNSGIFVISLNRPAVKNAVSRNMMKELAETLDKLHFNKNVRVIILRSSSPGIFCAGADLKERITLSPEEIYQTVGKFRSLTLQIESTPFPVIAAVDGFALGGGFEIALACDIRVASSEARFGLVETKLAIIPGAGGTQRLPRIVGPSIAKELIFTGRIIDAKSAKEYGILNHVVEQNDSKDAAFAKALEISHEILPNGPLGVKMAKTAINKGSEVDMNTGCAIEDHCYARVIPTTDRLEGLKAFAEKRKPIYKGE